MNNASSAHYTLVVMSWVAIIFTPVVLGYQGWTYWVFRKRLTASGIAPKQTRAVTGPDTMEPVGGREAAGPEAAALAVSRADPGRTGAD